MPFKANLNTNFKGFKFLENLIKNIIERLEKIENGDGTIKNLENTIKSIYNRINDLQTKHDNEMNIEIENRKNNDIFLQNQINSNLNNLKITITDEINEREKGDKDINARLNSIQFLKWLKSEDFGENINDEKMILGQSDWTLSYDFDSDSYVYPNTYIVNVSLVLSQTEISQNYHDYGLSVDIKPKNGDERKAKLEVKYYHEKNILGDKSANTVYLNILFSQNRVDIEPNPMPY